MPSDSSLWFLTNNRHKFREAESILASRSITIRQLKESKVEIQSYNLESIARFALERALTQHRRRMLVEDSGLFIEALDWFPGPYSSYVHSTIGITGVLELLRNQRNRRAYFKSSVVFGSPGTLPRLFTGKVEGRISKAGRGKLGFGYDPIFIPDGSNETFGETSSEFKNTKSHRATAFLKFADWFSQSRLVSNRSQSYKRALK